MARDTLLEIHRCCGIFVPWLELHERLINSQSIEDVVTAYGEVVAKSRAVEYTSLLEQVEQRLMEMGLYSDQVMRYITAAAELV